MGTMDYNRIINRLDKLSPDQLRDLRAELDARLGGNREQISYDTGYEAGRADENARAGEVFLRHYLPIMNQLIEFNSAIHHVIGIAAVGYGRLAKEAIKRPATRVKALMDSMDWDATRARNEGVYISFSEDMRPFLIDLYKAAKAYYTEPNNKGNELRRVAESFDMGMVTLASTRKEKGLGAGRSTELDELCERLHKYRTGDEKNHYQRLTTKWLQI